MALDPTQDYKTPYHTYPIFSTEGGFEGAQKRYVSLPTPQDLINFGLKGLPKVYPMTNEPITIDDVERYLTSAMSQIEMQLGIDITPVEHFQSFDYVDGMFSNNWTGLKLSRWPATQVLNMRLKFSHTQSNDPLQSYQIPAPWIALRRNRLNIAINVGALTVTTGTQGSGVGALGIFGYIYGFARGSYQPAIIEVQYVSGFEPDKLPPMLADLILTQSAIYMLSDIGPLLFPNSSTSVSIDAVSQSAGLPGPQFLLGRIDALKQKRDELEAALKAHFNKSIKTAFIGS